MIKESKTFIRCSRPYFKQNIDRLPDRTVRKKRYNHNTVQFIGYSMSDISLKKKEKRIER